MPIKSSQTNCKAKKSDLQGYWQWWVELSRVESLIFWHLLDPIRSSQFYRKYRWQQVLLMTPWWHPIRILFCYTESESFWLSLITPVLTSLLGKMAAATWAHLIKWKLKMLGYIWGESQVTDLSVGEDIIMTTASVWFCSPITLGMRHWIQCHFGNGWIYTCSCPFPWSLSARKSSIGMWWQRLWWWTPGVPNRPLAVWKKQEGKRKIVRTPDLKKINPSWPA